MKMTAPRAFRRAALSLAVLVTASAAPGALPALTAQQGVFYGSIDAASPEAGARSPADLLEIRLPGCGLDPAVQAPMLGVPPGGNVDAFSSGMDVFDAAHGPIDGPGGGRAVAGRFSVDRSTVGGGAVRNQQNGNGAASDVFRIQFLPVPTPPQLDLDAPCLSPQSDLDAISDDARFPLYFSVDPLTAQDMGVSPADILWLEAPGVPPSVFIAEPQLGLQDGDDIDALSVGPEGFLFSLTRNSPTAQLHVDVGGAGLFANGPFPWADAAQCGLLPTDELNAIVTFDPTHTGIEYRHTPMLPGQNTIFRVEGLQPAEQPFVLMSFQGLNSFCFLGVCLDLVPDFILGPMPPADPLGGTEMVLPIPPGTAGIDLATQALVPRGPIGPNWNVSNPVPAQVQFAWMPIDLTRGAANNGYQVRSPGGVEVIHFTNVNIRGAALNGPHKVTIVATVNGRRVVWQPTVNLTAGSGQWAPPIGPGDNLAINSVRVYGWL